MSEDAGRIALHLVRIEKPEDLNVSFTEDADRVRADAILEPASQEIPWHWAGRLRARGSRCSSELCGTRRGLRTLGFGAPISQRRRTESGPSSSIPSTCTAKRLVLRRVIRRRLSALRLAGRMFHEREHTAGHESRSAHRLAGARHLRDLDDARPVVVSTRRPARVAMTS